MSALVTLRVMQSLPSVQGSLRLRLLVMRGHYLEGLHHILGKLRLVSGQLITCAHDLCLVHVACILDSGTFAESVREVEYHSQVLEGVVVALLFVEICRSSRDN